MSISRTSSIRNPNLILALNPVVVEHVHMLLSSKLNHQHVKSILPSSHVIVRQGAVCAVLGSG